MIRSLLIAISALIALPAAAGHHEKGESDKTDVGEAAAQKILIFSHTTGWRHPSIETGIAALTELGEDAGYDVMSSEDPDVFSTAVLEDIDIVLLLNNTTSPKDEATDWFDENGRGEAFQAFVRSGGGVVGVHAASDSHYFWPWYGQMIGGYFERHPKGAPEGRLSVVNSATKATNHMPAAFTRADEWYWITDFNPEVELLLTLDPSSIGEPDVNPKPISWRHEFDGGRVFYTAMGHTEESYSDPVFLQHVRGGIDWAAGGSD
jgi:type 1 glutamine amidotransferase